MQSAHRGGWISRLGVRAMQAGGQDASKVSFRPYGALNWWYARNLREEVLLNKSSTSDLYPRNRLELKGGVAVSFRVRASAA
ncbi:autotransporter domain-containing protein [Variovorax sp. J22R133]|uniref:autotransporter domain-containing protein n=1 Tax=Variovorax brevis TaxID=3053503 RepID=UPI002578F845|nr:autotransporter domain-containing protein [Variovorax sp. J22R133]MDM0116837.1 autotransporter domain-containing protein [Variovorax sp. J22R133]